MPMKKKFKTWLAILILVIIVTLGYSYFLRHLNETKQKIDFYGCQTNLTKFYVKQSFHCGDLQHFINHNEYVIMIQCLCKKYNGDDLSSKLNEYLNNYAAIQKEELMRESNEFYNGTTIEDIRYYGYNPLEKPPICTVRRYGCA